jgi:DNA polymerase
MCVGEAPGAREDEMGLPFVGRAGQLLDRLLLSVGFAREEVYICNVLKCRPPGNRNPEPEEIELCSPFLRRQVALVEPEVVVAFGTFAAQTLLGVRETLGRMRGRVHEYQGVPLIVTYHPAALLRNPHWKRPSWEDLQLVRRTLAENVSG